MSVTPVLVDSCGWIEYFRGGELAALYEPALLRPADELIVPAICLYEVYKRVAQLTGPDEALKYAGALAAATLVPLDADLALQAAQLSLRLGLPMADSMVLATARSTGAEVWTHDVHFANLPGVNFIRA